MPVELASERSEGTPVIHLASRSTLKDCDLDARARRWAQAAGFDAAAGSFLLLPDGEGGVSAALFGLAEGAEATPLALGALARKLPAGRWRFADGAQAGELATLGLLLGGYAFTRYGRKPTPDIVVETPDGVDAARIAQEAQAVFLARDLVNTPASDMGPAELEAAMRDLAAAHGAELSVVAGDDLVTQNLPMIHAVGRAAAAAPRLLDLSWGQEDAPAVTLVGKGVCFDTGGLNIKPAGGMLLMKKDMGGAASAMALAALVMGRRLNVRLRLLVPAVENSIGGGSFRPGDVLRARSGRTVEIGNTDAEGRLILADALTLADEDAPHMLLDLATLTGAARVALGPDLPPFYTDDEELAGDLAEAARAHADPLWRMPLWRPYAAKLASKVADTNNVTTDGFAGSITAALFLSRFVEKAQSWAHFDIFGWNPVEKPWCPVGGEAQGVRALAAVLERRYGKG